MRPTGSRRDRRPGCRRFVSSAVACDLVDVAKRPRRRSSRALRGRKRLLGGYPALARLRTGRRGEPFGIVDARRGRRHRRTSPGPPGRRAFDCSVASAGPTTSASGIGTRGSIASAARGASDGDAAGIGVAQAPRMPRPRMTGEMRVRMGEALEASLRDLQSGVASPPSASYVAPLPSPRPRARSSAG